jgi:hypothetical protein
MRVNLLEKDEGLKINWLEILVVLLIIFVFALPITNYYFNYLELNNLKQSKANWENRLKAIEPKEEYYYELENEVANFKLPAKVELEKYTVAAFFLEFSRIIDKDISFNNLEYSSGRINIRGNAENVRSLLDFSSRIFNSDVFSIISLERFQNNDQLEFNLQVQLDNKNKGVIYNE